VRPVTHKAVVLLSGGLDSATVLAIARERGFALHALSVAYGQRHDAELEAARRIAAQAGVLQHQLIRVNLDAFGGSALTDPAIAVPEQPADGIPVTYVPARNTLFLSLALGWAEVLDARDIFIGVNAVDYSGYPDCRPAFIAAFEALARIATKAGVEGGRFTVHAPLLHMRALALASTMHRPCPVTRQMQAVAPAAAATPAGCVATASRRPDCRIRRAISTRVRTAQPISVSCAALPQPRVVSSVGRAAGF
jgi:7-cyano-7-deazaguanine synthase